MSVVGIDFGTLHSKIGVARHRGIDIIVNEVSNRSTPSLVGFGVKQRHIGEPAKTQETSNFKNTIGCLKRLIGRTVNDPDVQEIEKKFINAQLVDVQGSVGVQVKYIGDTATFSATQLVAMYLGKLRDIAAAELKVGVTDVVIAVPGWFTDVQRRALLDAASIAGLNTLRLVNDTTATALGYGITKSDLPDNPEDARNVVFIDVGHSSLSCAVVGFAKGQLSVKATAYDRNLGGRDIDFALVRHFAEEFKTKYKIDVLSSPKAVFRLAASCEKLKKILSANAEAPLSVESIMNDVDASSKLTREQLEELIAPVLERIQAPLLDALRESGLSLDQIDAIELVGGSTRVPAVRARIQSAFPGKALSTTLNQDEAIARGATFTCAMLSPVFRVRDFATHDIQQFPVKVQWDASQSDPEDDTELIVFPRGNGLPSTKVLTFYRKDAFDLEAVYAEPDGLPGGINPWIARFAAKNIAPDPKGDPTIVRVKTKLDMHGIVSFTAAYTEETEEKEESVANMDVDGAEAAPPKKKKIVRKKDVSFITGNSSLDPSIVERMREQEAEMHAADKLVMDTEDRKNALEEYVYDMRGKLDERYATYVQPQEKEKLLADLQVAEDWLYTEEGEEATKSAYVSRLDALKALGDPIAFRWREAEGRQSAIAALREQCNTYMTQAQSEDEKYSHIEAKDKQSVVEKCATIMKWVEDQSIRQMERAKNVDPILTTAEINKKRDDIIYFATPILTRPKPKPPVLPTPTPSGTSTPNPPPSGTPNPEKQQQQQPEPPKADGEAQPEAKGPSEMDVD